MARFPVRRVTHQGGALAHLLRVHCYAPQSDSAGVEVEYVSAPREYEELLQAKDEPESSNTFVPGGGVGFVSAGTSTTGLGSGGEPPFQCPHLSDCSSLYCMVGEFAELYRRLRGLCCNRRIYAGVGFGRCNACAWIGLWV